MMDPSDENSCICACSYNNQVKYSAPWIDGIKMKRMLCMRRNKVGLLHFLKMWLHKEYTYRDQVVVVTVTVYHLFRIL